MAKETWIVVANSTLARIFRLDKLQLIEMDTMINPEGRLHDKDLATDKPGVAFDGSGRYAMTKEHSPKEAEVESFAKKVAAHIDHARAVGQIDRIFLAANPGFLGLLRSSLTNPTAGIISHSVDKDITNMKPDDIRGYFPIGL